MTQSNNITNQSSNDRSLNKDQIQLSMDNGLKDSKLHESSSSLDLSIKERPVRLVETSEITDLASSDQSSSDESSSAQSNDQSTLFKHPFYSKLEISLNQVSKYEELVKTLKLHVQNSFDQLFLGWYAYFENSSQGEVREKIAKAIVTTGVLKIQQKVDLPIPFVNKKETSVTTFISYSFSSLISNGTLLACLLIHPSYFVGNPVLVLKQFSEAFLAIDTALKNFILQNFQRQIEQAAYAQYNDQQLASFKPHERKRALENARKKVVDACSFELFATAIQYGLVVNTMDFKIESRILPNVVVVSDELRNLIFPVLNEHNCSLRILARVLNPIIFMFAYQNIISGYLTPKLKHFLTPSTARENRVYEEALMVEIHRNSPFITPKLKKALESHQKLLNKK